MLRYPLTNQYDRWNGENVLVIFDGVRGSTEILKTFVEYPLSQMPVSFSVNQIADEVSRKVQQMMQQQLM